MPKGYARARSKAVNKRVTQMGEDDPMSEDISRQEDFVLRTLEERNIRFVRLWFTDVLGFLKSVAIAPAELDNAFAEGIGFDGSAIEGYARLTESDMLAKPDAGTFSVLPWRTQLPGAARMICDITLPDGPTPLIYVVAVVAGIGFSAQWVCPWSMLPDVIEYDEKMTGERREGIYYGLWAFLGKFTGALGIAVCGWALSGYGYMPNVAQTVQTLFGIRFFFAIIPAVVLLISLPFLIWYPITRKSHAALVQELADRKAAATKTS